jgi:hypothetical protein
MRRQVLDHVALHVAADHAHVVVAVDLEVEERRQEAALLEPLESTLKGMLIGSGSTPPP